MLIQWFRQQYPKRSLETVKRTTPSSIESPSKDLNSSNSQVKKDNWTETNDIMMKPVQLHLKDKELSSNNSSNVNELEKHWINLKPDNKTSSTEIVEVKVPQSEVRAIKIPLNKDVKNSTSEKPLALPIPAPTPAEPMKLGGHPELANSKVKPIENPKVKPIEEPRSKPIENPKAKPIEEPKVKPIEQPKTNPIEQPKAKPIEEPKQAPKLAPKVTVDDIPDDEKDDYRDDVFESARDDILDPIPNRLNSNSSDEVLKEFQNEALDLYPDLTPKEAPKVVANTVQKVVPEKVPVDVKKPEVKSVKITTKAEVPSAIIKPVKVKQMPVGLPKVPVESSLANTTTSIPEPVVVAQRDQTLNITSLNFAETSSASWTEQIMTPEVMNYLYYIGIGIAVVSIISLVLCLIFK